MSTMHGRTFVGADRFKPTTDRAVRPRVVACPECKAEIGDGCVTAAGTPMQGYHRCRRRMAVRLDNETRLNS